MLKKTTKNTPNFARQKPSIASTKIQTKWFGGILGAWEGNKSSISFACSLDLRTKLSTGRSIPKDPWIHMLAKRKICLVRLKCDVSRRDKKLWVLGDFIGFSGFFWMILSEECRFLLFISQINQAHTTNRRFVPVSRLLQPHLPKVASRYLRITFLLWLSSRSKVTTVQATFLVKTQVCSPPKLISHSWWYLTFHFSAPFRGLDTFHTTTPNYNRNLASISSVRLLTLWELHGWGRGSTACQSNSALIDLTYFARNQANHPAPSTLQLGYSLEKSVFWNS